MEDTADGVVGGGEALLDGFADGINDARKGYEGCAGRTGIPLAINKGHENGEVLDVLVDIFREALQLFDA